MYECVSIIIRVRYRSGEYNYVHGYILVRMFVFAAEILKYDFFSQGLLLFWSNLLT